MIAGAIGELEYAFDGLQRFMKKHIMEDGSDKSDYFNRRYLSELVACLDELDPNLLESVNAQWKGFKDYSKLENKDWKRCHENGTYNGYVRKYFFLLRKIII